MPGDALMRYTIPMPEDSRIPAWKQSMKPLRRLEDDPTPHSVAGGPSGIRTLDTRIKSPLLCLTELTAREDS